MVASRNRRIEEHKLLIASFRRCKVFVKACSKASPSASNVFWAGGGIATFPASERIKRSLCKAFQARNRLCFEASNSSSKSWIAFGVIDIELCSSEHLCRQAKCLIHALQKFKKPLKVTVNRQLFGKNRKGQLYATSRSSDQNGIKTDASAFRRPSKAGYRNAVRKGLAGCDNPAIQSVAPASNENWIEESAYRQKDSDNIESLPPRLRKNFP
jgi:hypothetical protein